MTVPLTPHPLVLSLSKHPRFARPKHPAPRKAFDRLRLSGVGLLGLVLIAGTYPAQAKPKPKSGFEAALPVPAAAPRVADGAIFDAAAGYAPLYTGHRAYRIGDPVTVVLVETVTASKSAGSKTQRGGSAAITPPATGVLSFLKPSSLNAASSASFKGDGTATQTSTLAGEVAVTIAEVRAGGTALVRGEKRLLLSQGQEWIQFSGIVRLSDIDADNRVASSRVADARIEYAGNGAVSRAGKEGWLSRFFGMISPF